MTTQPEALRLADLLDCSVVVSDQQAAAELRQLHEETKLNQELVKEAQEMAIKLSGENVLLRQELERCKRICAATHATSEEWRKDAEELRLKRDVLLEALKVVLDDLMYKDHARVIDVARAAIATVEGEKT